jgi:serine/threonine-protein kinase HipA
MAGRRVDVRLGEKAVPVGTLTVEANGAREVSHFRYHDSWIEREHSFALAPSMPLKGMEFFNRADRDASALPAPLSDATPDSWGRKLIDRLLKAKHLTDLDYLVETDDFLRTGALRIFDQLGQQGKPLAQPRDDGIQIPRLHDLSSVIVQARAFDEDPDEYARKRADMVGGDLLRSAAGTLGGARPKVNAIDGDGDLWIVKLPKQTDDYSVERVEVMTLRLAKEVGIQAAHAEILNTDTTRPVSIIRRFDRMKKGSARIPFISAQTFLGKVGTDPGTYEEIAMQLRTYGQNPASDILELFRRMMFTVLIRNTDDHLRNHGMLRGASGWLLSPAYDVNPETKDTHLKTGISEIHGYETSLESVLDASEFFDVTRDDAEKMAGEMGAKIKGKWHLIGRCVGMTSRDFSAISEVIENEELKLACSLQQRDSVCGPSYA